MDTYDDVPFDALIYLTAECNYGGRVTDNADRRLISSLLSNFYCPEMLVQDKPYRFCATLQEYFVPPPSTSSLLSSRKDASYDDYVEYIRNLPLIAHPEVFGLDLNANITRDYQETQNLFNGILLTLPREVRVSY